MTVKLLTGHLLEILSLKGGCTGSSVPTLVKMRHCWKSRVAAHFIMKLLLLKYTFTIGNADREDTIIIILLLCKPRSDSYILAYKPLLSINLVLSLVRKCASFNVCGQVSTVQLVIELVRLLLKPEQD